MTETSWATTERELTPRRRTGRIIEKDDLKRPIGNGAAAPNRIKTSLMDDLQA